MLILAFPLYAALYGLSLVVPLYALLFVLGVGLLYLLLNRSKGLLFEEVIGLVTMLGGISCLIVGFALAPLLVQLLTAIGLAIFSRRSYQVNIKPG